MYDFVYDKCFDVVCAFCMFVCVRCMVCLCVSCLVYVVCSLCVRLLYDVVGCVVVFMVCV